MGRLRKYYGATFYQLNLPDTGLPGGLFPSSNSLKAPTLLPSVRYPVGWR
jgi:hypothetical protein